MPRDNETGRIRPLTGDEAMERHIALVHNDQLGLRLNRSQNHYVYHYTNVVGLRGIIDSRSIWASDYHFLNDASEIVFGLQILEMLTASRHGIAGYFDNELRQELLMALAMTIEGRNNYYVFSASFCRKGNLLSQWRGYSGQDGIAIGFRRDFLERRARNNGFVSGPVHYYFSPVETNVDLLNQWLGTRAAALQETLQGLEERVRAELEEDEGDLLDTLVRGRRAEHIDRWILETAAFIKHPTFSEEAEWRCITVPDRHRLPGRNVQDRPSGSRIIPYVNFELGQEEDREIGIGHVVVGPNANLEALDHAIMHIAFSRGITIGGIMMPGNPFRM